MPDRADRQETLARPLGLFDATCLGVNAIVGSSIFLFPARLADLLGPASILAFGLTGTLVAFVGLAFAEASTHFDRAGGPYLYATRAFGGTAGYGIGWMCWMTLVLSWAAVSNGIATYLGWFHPSFASVWWVKGIAAVVIVGMGTLNYRGVKLGAWTSNFFTMAKLVPLSLFVLLGLRHVRGEALGPFAPHGLAPLGPACFMAYFAMQGFENVPVPAGEMRDPQRNVPIAVVASLVFSTLFYMAIQLVAFGAYPGLAQSQRPLADAAAAVLGSWGAAMMVAGSVISTTGFNAGCALGGPRYAVALADDGHLPRGLSKPHPRFGTPYQAVLWTTGLTLGAALLLDFKKLVDFSNVVVCAQYLATCAAVPVLRKLEPRVHGFKTPFGPLVPALGIGATLWLGLQGAWGEVWAALGVLVLGFILRAAFQRAGLARAALACALLALAAGTSLAQNERPEDLLQSRISAEKLAEFDRALSREVRVAGTPGALRAAEYMEAKFREHGLEVRRAEYQVLLSYPELVSVVLDDAELAVPEGRLLPNATAFADADLMPWNAYSPSGKGEYSAVYANYGRPEDFEALEKLGVSVKGRLVLTRYSHGYRGGKAQEAERRGAAAILFYSDPADDGYVQGDPMPRGPWGAPDHFQRGANVFDFIEPGDAKPRVLPKIPSAPLSYPGAQKILESMDGPRVPGGWQGGLPLSYHAGPSRRSVAIDIRMKNERRRIVDVLGELKGAQQPEKLVILSAHHDAWTRGAVDDGIGGAVLLELSRVLGELAKEGQRPRRTILFASWDAEEYTLTGSTEWGMENAERLTKDGVAVLNVDAYRWGDEFTSVGVPALHGLLAGALGDVPDPKTGRPLVQAWRQQAKARGEEAGPGAVGSGSDYTVFLNRLGIPTLETMFTGTGGVYHSIYDAPEWIERVDPGWRYVGALARVNGLMAWRLADAQVLAFDYGAYARWVRRELDSLAVLSPRTRKALGPAMESAKAWEASAVRFEKALSKPATAEQERRANEALLAVERALLDPDGLPGRPWFRHLLYAPKPSYEPLTLPGIQEAIDAGDWKRAAEQAQRLDAALGRAAAALRRAAAALERRG